VWIQPCDLGAVFWGQLSQGSDTAPCDSLDYILFDILGHSICQQPQEIFGVDVELLPTGVSFDCCSFSAEEFVKWEGV